MRKWIDSGSLPALRIGPASARVHESELERCHHLYAPGATTEPGRAGDTAVAEIEAQERFLVTALDLVRSARSGLSAELAAALRDLAARAERWAQTLDSGNAEETRR